MISWNAYPYFAIAVVLCWFISAVAAWKQRQKLSLIFSGAGIVIFAAFMVLLWQSLQRPPLRTMGETRLWYALFLAIAGNIIYTRWKYRWISLFTSVVSSVFVLINIFKPDLHSITLMPALQSPWFIPHVTVYILSYAMLGMATIIALMQCFSLTGKQNSQELQTLMDNCIYIGFGFLMLGLISGAVWAKQAWGHYWEWDPKETWAFITAVAYLICIHLRLNTKYAKYALWFLPVAFILLMVAWIGVNYLPAAQTSVHVYYM